MVFRIHKPLAICTFFWSSESGWNRSAPKGAIKTNVQHAKLDSHLVGNVPVPSAYKESLHLAGSLVSVGGE